MSWGLKGLPGEIQIIDLACGAGRMWPPLLERSSLTLPCLDDSPGMLRAGLAATEHRDRLSPIQGSIFSLPFADRSADAVVCMRFMHHLAFPEDRRRALSELFRVTRSVAVISLWVDGNLQAWRRRNVDASRDPQPGFGRRRCLPRSLVEAEFADAGFSSMHKRDLYPRLSSWRTYRLEKPA